MTHDDSYSGRIVVGYDGSAGSEQAVTWAADEARVRGRGLFVVHAVQPPTSAATLGAGLAPPLDLTDALESQARETLDAVAARLSPLDVDTGVAIGGASGVLLKASETAELVVLGSRGHGGFASLILGSVASQVAAHAVCPVVTVRGAASAAATRIIVGIDPSPESAVAADWAFDEASRRGWTLTAVHAWDVPSYDLLIIPEGPLPVHLADVADDEVRLSAEALAGLRERYPDVTVEELLVRGPAVGALLDAAADAAMIVVGSRGHGPTVGALLGSVSHGVLHKSPVPVVVVPRVEEPDYAA